MRGLFVMTLLVTPGKVMAHNGPPFPIIEDREVGPCNISVWTHPDIGTGTFFVMINEPAGGEIPADLEVQIGVRPLSGRLEEALYTAGRENLRGQVQFKALVDFDVQELWQVRVILKSARGAGEVISTVEPTPIGPGRWDTLVYLVPFLAIGFLWLMSAVRRRTRKKTLGNGLSSEPM